MLTLLGPTATGKTALAAAIAAQTNAEIISADSRQVYKGMNLGTGKDYADYQVQGASVTYHLLDIVDPGYEYNVYAFTRDFYRTYRSVAAQGKRVILCGGTGFYLEAVLGNYRLEKVPENRALRHEFNHLSLKALEDRLKTLKTLHNHTDTDSRERLIRALEIETYYAENSCDRYPSIPSVIVGIHLEREQVRERITHRLHARLEAGMVEEVQQLLDSGVDSERLIFYGLEYKYITWYLLGRISKEEMVTRLNIAIHQFAKRQMTWFRRMERKGFIIHWIDGRLPMEEKVDEAIRIWQQEGDF
jgi:tRNA dimethylallyltransferase